MSAHRPESEPRRPPVVQNNSGEGSRGQAGPGGNVRRTTYNAILVNVCQKGNPIIQHIRTAPWEWGDVPCDYQVGGSTGLLFLSLRYHRLHPEYIHQRIEKIGQMYSLRLLLVQCDVDNDHATTIKELTKICLINNITIIVAWSPQEAGHYLELFKGLEMKPPDMIKERVDNDYMSHLTSTLTSIRGVNKTDVLTLISNFGSFEKIALASPESLLACPGVGEKKVKRMREAFSGALTLKSKKRKGNAEKNADLGPELN